MLLYFIQFYFIKKYFTQFSGHHEKQHIIIFYCTEALTSLSLDSERTVFSQVTKHLTYKLTFQTVVHCPFMDKYIQYQFVTVTKKHIWR